MAAVSPLNCRSINIPSLEPSQPPMLRRPLLPCLLPRPLPPAAPNELIARVAKEKTRENGTKWPLRNAVRPSVRFFVRACARVRYALSQLHRRSSRVVARAIVGEGGGDDDENEGEGASQIARGV